MYYGPESIYEVDEYQNAISVPDTSYVVTDLTPETTYFFAVIAENQDNLLLSSLNYSTELSAQPEVKPVARSAAPQSVQTTQQLPVDGQLTRSGPLAAAALAVAACGSWLLLRRRK